ncbi:hypothetical protein IFM89_027976 [Coptis chinensis]|uniref:Pentatricopeptide repeat-containing protein n=1 Tax=Coptis chinensis TaxID=261450 RepID=A0A835IGC3_9MAGN|nr:hypothetical protein IFM89_027976 [Coptis chinensis]
MDAWVTCLEKSGAIKEAMEMIEGMPMKADVFVWGGLLGGCRIHGNVEVAEIAAQRLMELDHEDGGVYTVMANIYAQRKEMGRCYKDEEVNEWCKEASLRGVGCQVQGYGLCSQHSFWCVNEIKYNVRTPADPHWINYKKDMATRQVVMRAKYKTSVKDPGVQGVLIIMEDKFSFTPDDLT